MRRMTASSMQSKAPDDDGDGYGDDLTILTCDLSDLSDVRVTATIWTSANPASTKFAVTDSTTTATGRRALQVDGENSITAANHISTGLEDDELASSMTGM